MPARPGSGRKKKPESLIAIEGRKGHRTKAEIAARQGPGFGAGDIEPPEHLKGLALETWETLAPEYFRLGLVKQPTRFALEGACVAYAQAVEADKVLAEKGFTVEVYADKDGELFCTGVKVRPEVKISHESWNRFKGFCVEFGMTPASESRIMAPQASKADPVEDAMCA